MAVYLERFFRNMLLGEKWDLRNRFLHINATDEWKVQPNLAYATSTQQVEDKYGTSAGQVQDKLQTDDANIKRLVLVIGNQELSVKNMMDASELKGRDNFLNLYLKPAVREGYVRLLYPNSPRHPRQKIPAFFHVTTASVNDSKVMKEIPIDTGAYYIFDRGDNNFKELYRIHRAESFFVVRAKTNLQYRCVKWKT